MLHDEIESGSILALYKCKTPKRLRVQAIPPKYLGHQRPKMYIVKGKKD